MTNGFKTIFISGPISSVPNAVERFDAVVKEFEDAEDYCIINPMGLMKVYNHIPITDWEFWNKLTIKLLVDCDVIYLMKGWENSKGCLLEKQIAEALKMEIWYE